MLAVFQTDRVLFMYYWENNFEDIAESHAHIFNAYIFIHIHMHIAKLAKDINHLIILGAFQC